jgi:hypothetical protein
MSHESERCPRCGSVNTDYDEIETRPGKDGNVVFNWFCYDCPCWWNVEYTYLMRYTVEHDETMSNMEE